MAKPSEEISKYNANKNGKTDANLANDSNHLGGVPADDFATKKYVHDFHGAKEELLKQYIDNQDENKLDQAKSYTDTVVRNQDFSDFLKTADKIALQQQIAQCGENCANNLNNAKNGINSRIDGVVSDVNNNFNSVNGAITNLNNITNNLFTSVSNGKSQIASAITDKGVSTTSDASFSTMANNIRSIVTNSGGNSGSGSGGSTGIDTSDATATSNTIFAGYTAYARGQKILGTYIPPYERSEDGITYIDNGIDTSDATATASDIAVGKTAYVNGNKITGTYRQVTDTSRNGYNTINSLSPNSSSITEYYGASMEAFSIKNGYILEPTNVNLLKFNPDNTYSIEMCRKDGTDTTELGRGLFDYTIRTHRVIDSGQVWTISNSTTVFENLEGEIEVGSPRETVDKYEWTKAELGLADNEVVNNMILGSPGVMGREDLCWLIIEVLYYTYDENTNRYITKQYYGGGTPNYKYYLYTFNMTKSGIIGKTSTNDTHFVWHQEIDIPKIVNCLNFQIIPANLNCNTFLLFGSRGGTGQSRYLYGGHAKLRVSTEFSETNGVNIILSKKFNAFYYVINNPNDNNQTDLKYPHLSGDDRFVSFVGAGYHGLFASISESYEVAGYYRMLSGHRYLYVPSHNRIIDFETTMSSNAYNGVVPILDGGNCSSVESGNQMNSFTSLGTITLPEIRTNSTKRYYQGKYTFLSPDYSKLFVAYSKEAPESTITDIIYVVYNVDDLLHTDGNGDLDPIFTELQRSDTISEPTIISRSRGSEKIVMAKLSSGNMVVWNNKIDKGNVIMVRYKDMWFQRIKYGQLTAGQPDVKEGKTYIGWMGYPEIGNNTDI